MNTVLHPHEEERLAALRRQGILDTGSDRRYDRLVFMAARLLNVPIAVVSFVDSDRIWIKAKVGTEESELNREDSPCSFSILKNSPLVIEDTASDTVFRDSAYVKEAPFMRFYAGVNIYSEDGLPIGVLSVADDKPRQIDRLELQALSAWAHEAEDLLHASAKIH